MERSLLFVFLVLLLLPIAYGVQVNSSTDIFSFDVVDCQVNNSNIGCPAIDVRFSCNITPYAYIDYTLFRINGTDYVTQRSGDFFYYDWHKGVTPYDANTSVAFGRGQIHDIGGGDALFFPNNTVMLNCDACNYNVTSDPCQSNDSRIVHYVGDGSPNCTSYNASESCDYCVPDWQITSSCLTNNSEYRQYQDNNACFNITGLYADSCGYSFIDCDTWKPCSYLSSDMSCDFDVNPLINLIGTKVNWKCSIANKTATYSCVSYVKQQGSTIQTNPQQKTYSGSIIPIQQETRDYFSADNGLVQPYFLTDGLQSNITYVFGVQCSSPTGSLITEHYVTPLYAPLDVIPSRANWVKDNIGYVVGAVIFLIIIIGVVMLVVKI